MESLQGESAFTPEEAESFMGKRREAAMRRRPNCEEMDLW
jgi:hypothetical protein